MSSGIEFENSLGESSSSREVVEVEAEGEEGLGAYCSDVPKIARRNSSSEAMAWWVHANMSPTNLTGS